MGVERVWLSKDCIVSLNNTPHQPCTTKTEGSRFQEFEKEETMRVYTCESNGSLLDRLVDNGKDDEAVGLLSL